MFITGQPGVGKTTAVRRIVGRLLEGSIPMTGFLTEEVREGERRVGFRGVTLDGKIFPLARLGGTYPIRVGPYGVDLPSLDAVGVPSLGPGPDTRLVVVDEVGKMESFSAAFREAVERLLAGPTPVLGTVARHGVGFVKRVRSDPRVTLLELRRDSRAWGIGEALRLLEGAGVLEGSGLALERRAGSRAR